MAPSRLRTHLDMGRRERGAPGLDGVTPRESRLVEGAPAPDVRGVTPGAAVRYRPRIQRGGTMKLVRVSMAVGLLWAAQAGAQAPGVQIGPGGVKVTGADGQTVDIKKGGVTVDSGAAGKVKVDKGAATGGATPPAKVAAPGGAQGPVTCHGNQKLEFDGITIRNGSGPAIRSSGNCSITAKNCSLEGSSFAVEASGNSSVTLHACKLTGKENAIKASGNSSVTLKDTALTGGVSKSGLAVIENAGGSTGL